MPAKSVWLSLSNAINQLSEIRESLKSFAKNGRVRIIDTNEAMNTVEGSGRYLLRPPLVGRDASLLHNSLKERGFASLVVCREPKTKLGLCPVVSLGSGVTVRVQVEEPSNKDQPTCAWFDYALGELGQHVLDMTDKQDGLERQLDYLIAHFPSISSYKVAYQKAALICGLIQEAKD